MSSSPVLRHHGGQGGQHANIALGARRKKLGVWPSMDAVGEAYDNATVESLFSDPDCELSPAQLGVA